MILILALHISLKNQENCSPCTGGVGGGMYAIHKYNRSVSYSLLGVGKY